MHHEMCDVLLMAQQLGLLCDAFGNRTGDWQALAAAGVGEKKALQLVQKFGEMKDVMASLEGGKYVVPEPFPYEEARKLFKGEACAEAPHALCPSRLRSKTFPRITFLSRFRSQGLISPVVEIDIYQDLAPQTKVEARLGWTFPLT